MLHSESQSPTEAEDFQKNHYDNKCVYLHIFKPVSVQLGAERILASFNNDNRYTVGHV